MVTIEQLSSNIYMKIYPPKAIIHKLWLSVIWKPTQWPVICFMASDKEHCVDIVDKRRLK